MARAERQQRQHQPLRSTNPSSGRSACTNNKLTCAKITLLLAIVSAGGQPLVARSAPSDRSNSINSNYYGTYIGRLERRAHNVSGEVYVVDEQSLFIRGFNYDGSAPDAYFWSSTTSQQPSSQDGFIVPDEKGSTKPLERYLNKDIVLRLPEGKTLREINWLSIWSRQTKQNLGEIMIGKSFNIPRPLEIEPLSQLAHGVKSGPITIIDAQTLLVPDFHYDGLGPAGFFWLTRGSQGLSANGLRLKDENGSANPLRKYTGESVVIVLPDDLTVYDFDYFGVWCKEFQVNFGQTKIPQGSKVPPSPKMLGIKPENKLNCEILYDDLGFEIRWVLDGDDIVMQLVGKIEPGEYMAFGLGKDDSKSDMNNADAVIAWVNRSSGQVHAVDYFLGGKQQCINIVDPNKATGATCPDTKLPGGGDSLTLLHGAIVNGYSMVTFKRPQLGVDELYDQHVYSDGQQSVVWAIGSLNERNEPAYHRLRTRANMFIDFARNPHWNCPIPDHNASMHNNLPIPAASQVDPQVVLSQQQQQQQQQQRQQQPIITTTMLPTTIETDLINNNDLVSSARQSPIASSKPTQIQQPAISRQQQTDSSGSGEHSGHAGNGGQPIRNKSVDHNDPWFIPSIVCPSDRTFYAQIGPTGGHKGYEGLTGRTSWGVSWYINGLMIPELVIERGQMYRFVVEGGNVKTSPARRHPFYLTDSVEGGFDFKTDDERVKERIFAGVAIRGDEQYVPTAEGRLCEWKQTNVTLANPDLYQTFSAYQRTLKLECLPGQTSMLKFAPDSTTPDTIYYQCYTHRYMGWRIRVVNSCSAYLNALQQQRAGASSTGGGNNVKREAKNSRILEPAKQAAPKQKGAVINRRQLMEVNAIDPMKSSQSEPRIAFEASNHHTFLAPPAEFSPDELATSNNLQTIGAGGGGSNALDIIPNDMLILNDSQLIQKNLLNLSTIDEILKLSPSDLELIDNNQPDNSLEPYIQAAAVASGGTGFNTIPLPLHSFTANHLNLQGSSNNKHNSYNLQKGNKTTNSNNKSTTSQISQPKTLQSYLRRLASIYYPVQQQLASVLANNQQNGTRAVQIAALGAPTTNSNQALASSSSQNNQLHGNNNAAASSDQVSSFSLSNLVPKSKIDLSKSSISKKLNKLRFKTGRKYEPQQGHLVKPPRPANEFNYDIFNNQLAQLEKQQHQLQSLESLAAADWPQSTDASSLNPYLSMLASATSSVEEQQRFENSLANPLQQQQMLINNLLRQPSIPPSFQQQTSRFLPQQQQQPSFRPHPMRLSDIQNGALQPSQTSSLSDGLDHLMVALNRSNGYIQAPLLPLISNSQNHYLQQQQLSKHYEPSWMSQLNADLAPQPNRQFYSQQQNTLPPHHHHHQQQQHRDQSSVYITRLPQQSQDGGFNQQQQQQQMDAQAADRTPNWAINSNGNQQVTSSHSVRYPDIQPYKVNQQRPTTNQLSSMLSVSHEANQQQQSANEQTGGGAAVASIYPQSAAPTASPTGSQPADSDSLSGSGSGSHYDFTQQPPVEQQQQQTSMSRGQQQQQSGADDYMIAMERFSKQSSERRAPSIVHPVTGEQVHNVQQLESSTSPSNASAPKRFSSVLIDKNIVAPNGPAATSVQPSEVLDIDQTVQHVLGQPMQSNNVSQAQSFTNSSSSKRTGVFTNASNQRQQSLDGCSNGCQQQQSTTTVSSIFAPSPMSVLSTGPLTPSFGPPQMHTRFTSEGEAPPVYKSTLVEPIISSLVHQPSSSPLLPPQSQTRPFISNVNFDSSPFTPIEVTSSNPALYYSADHLQLAASNLLASHLSPPPPLTESMLIGQQHQGLHQFESLRSEPPPVQVASYLAQRLANHQSQPGGIGSGGSSSKQHQSYLNPPTATTAVPASELIILKPSKQQSAAQVFALKPEYVTNKFKPPVVDIATSSAAAATDTGDNTDFHYSNEIGASGEAVAASTTKRLAAGHQFDRLSSLSSPPSTSIALDPMQTANSMNSYTKQQQQQNSSTSFLDGARSRQQQQKTDHQDSFRKETGHSGNSTTTSVLSNQILPSVTIEAINDDNSKLARHRHSYIASGKPIALNFEMQNIVGGSSASADGVRIDPSGQMSSSSDINVGNTLNRDNNTDNAILSHVMSLISSNAVPTPPLIPGSSYSNSDYFLPIGDRTPRSIRG